VDVDVDVGVVDLVDVVDLSTDVHVVHNVHQVHLQKRKASLAGGLHRATRENVTS